MKRICVYCGSSPGRNPRYRQAASRLGKAMHERGLGLVYGGASVGMMGVIADALPPRHSLAARLGLGSA